jgi:hypothetical protein
MVQRSNLFVGVDIGRERLHVAAVNGRGELVLSVPIANDQNAINAIIRTVGLRKQPTMWAVDMKRRPGRVDDHAAAGPQRRRPLCAGGDGRRGRGGA